MDQERSKQSLQPTNIYIVGAQCTGKTTLVNALQDHFQSRGSSCTWQGMPISPPLIVREVARSVLQQHDYKAYDIVSSPSRALRLQELILEAQLKAEQEAKGAWFISDRSGFDPIIYTKRYVGDDAARELMSTMTWLELEKSMRRSLIVVCEAGAEWLFDDGVRLMPENVGEWIAFHKLFCASLDVVGLSYVVMPSALIDLDERVHFVVAHWEKKAHTSIDASE
ncbi:hypothetical protein MMC24_005359 [Lignoscripta atroalba]|nr:hypothetical protein [Lignoscripta atroalba]